MAKTKKRLGELDRETPRLHLVKNNIPCPWQIKGKVMRHLMKDTEALKRDLIEGVRVYPLGSSSDTSVFLNPDSSRPIFHINAESHDPAIARRLSEEYTGKIAAWITEE
jgi:mannose-1-phosphate guanylyltransferase/phosphomannomutase